jgi:hypothetical protein
MKTTSSCVLNSTAILYAIRNCESEFLSFTPAPDCVENVRTKTYFSDNRVDHVAKLAG